MSASRLPLRANPEQGNCGAWAAKGIGNKRSTHLKMTTVHLRLTPPLQNTRENPVMLTTQGYGLQTDS